MLASFGRGWEGNGKIIGVTYTVTTDNCAVGNSQAEHVRPIEQREVSANWVHPDAVRELRIPHADVAGDALGETIPRPVAEHGGHVHADVLAMLLEGDEGGDACDEPARASVSVTWSITRQ
jgi:hypothetical protein